MQVIDGQANSFVHCRDYGDMDVAFRNGQSSLLIAGLGREQASSTLCNLALCGSLK